MRDCESDRPAAKVIDGKAVADHDFIFFKDDCQPLEDLKYAYSRCRCVFEKLPIRYREPYNERYTFVTMNLTVGRNIVWVADQYGDSPEVMLTTYAHWQRVQWQRGATEEDIEAIKRAMASEETAAAHISATLACPQFPSELPPGERWGRLRRPSSFFEEMAHKGMAERTGLEIVTTTSQFKDLRATY